MKPHAIWAEAWANIWSGTTRAVLFSVLSAIILITLSGVELAQVNRVVRAAEECQSSGSSISILATQGRVDPQACQELSRVPGVRAAGALRTTDRRLVLAALPAAPIPIFDITPEFSLLPLPDSTPGTGLMLSDQAATDLQLEAGDDAVASTGTVRIADVYPFPSDGRSSILSFAALTPSNDTLPFDECWADIWPQSDQIRSLLYTTVLSGEDNQKLAISQLNSSLGTVFTGQKDFAERLTRFTPIAALVVGILTGYLSIRLRRLEIASNLHAGLSRRDQHSILTIETGFWLLVAAVLTVSADVILIVAMAHTDFGSYLVLAGRILFAGIVGALGGALTAWQLTREHHLFRYFKER